MGMNGTIRGSRHDRWVAPVLFALLITLHGAHAAEPAGRFDGPDNCAECHRPMHATWMHTAHFRTFTSAHRMRTGRRVANRLGIERIKQSEACAQCHYTVQPDTAKSALPLAGVSCESCHGPAEKWNAVHADPTDPDALKKAEAMGLIRPGNVAGMVNQCFKCHTVNDERLVNKGGHNPGSDFEMVAWLEGEIRHNFMKSRGARNASTPPEHKRLFYIVGQIAALERALGEFAAAKENGEYAEARVARRKRALERLRAVQQRVKSDVLQRIIELGAKAEPKAGSSQALRRAANSIRELGRKFSAGRDGSRLAAVDELLPATEDHIGDVYQP